MSNREIGRQLEISKDVVRDCVTSFKQDAVTENAENGKNRHPQETSPIDEITPTETEYEALQENHENHQMAKSVNCGSKVKATLLLVVRLVWVSLLCVLL